MERVLILERIPPLEEIERAYQSPTAGALVTFLGKPRNDNGIEALFYEVYDDMALKELQKIREEALKRFPVEEVFIYHAKGKVEVGRTSFLVAVFSKHRREAFECCSWIVDEVKKRVPIWKREVYPDGSFGEWILGI